MHTNNSLKKVSSKNNNLHLTFCGLHDTYKILGEKLITTY